MDNALLVGFDARMCDLGDRLRLCQPILTFGDGRTYLARRLDWQPEDCAERGALTLVDADDVAGFGTLVPDADRVPIERGVGVVVLGPEFLDAMERLGIGHQVQWLPQPPAAGGRLGLANVSYFDQFRAAIAEDVGRVVDDELAKAHTHGIDLSELGVSASRVLRECNWRRTDVAMRELAAAIVGRQPDLLRRRLTRYAIELESPERDLETQARQHLETVVGSRSVDEVANEWSRYFVALAEKFLGDEKWATSFGSTGVANTMSPAQQFVMGSFRMRSTVRYRPSESTEANRTVGTPRHGEALGPLAKSSATYIDPLFGLGKRNVRQLAPKGWPQTWRRTDHAA